MRFARGATKREGAGRNVGDTFLPAASAPRRASARGLWYNSGDNSADIFKLADFLPDAAKTGAGLSKPRSNPAPLFFDVTNNAHLTSPSHRLANVSVEEFAMDVCPKEIVTEEAVNLARQEHETVILRLMVSPGDSEGAMHRAEQVYGLSYWCQHNLRHKRRASADFVGKVHSAYVATLESSVRHDVAVLLKEIVRVSA